MNKMNLKNFVFGLIVAGIIGSVLYTMATANFSVESQNIMTTNPGRSLAQIFVTIVVSTGIAVLFAEVLRYKSA